MGCIRKARTRETFGEFVEDYVGRNLSSSKYAERVDFVFDSYTAESIKDSERQRRQRAPPIELDTVTGETKMPVKIETFWSSNSNKRKIQALIHEKAMETAKKCCPDVHVIASNMIGCDDQTPCLQSFNGTVSMIHQLNLAIEEADERIIPHALHAVTEHGTKRVVVISSDTDVFVLLLHYWEKLKYSGLKELWMKAGVADSTRFIPIHLLATSVGQGLCDVLPAVHALTG